MQECSQANPSAIRMHVLVVLPTVTQATQQNARQAHGCGEIEEDRRVSFGQPDRHRAGVVPVENRFRLGRQDAQDRRCLLPRVVGLEVAWRWEIHVRDRMRS